MAKTWIETAQSVVWAGMFDLSHRLVTCNMIELRRMVQRHLLELNLPRDSKMLDFGCGTGLYAGLFLREGLEYNGFDIDEKFLSFAEILYPKGRFHSRWADVRAAGPYALVVANCCFHHIGDRESLVALEDICSVLTPDGVFVLIDHVPPSASRVTRARRAYRTLERGEHIRRVDEYEDLVRPQFAIRARAIERSYVLSLASRFNPLFNELVVLQCGRRPQ